MSSSFEARAMAAADATYSAGTARCRWRMSAGGKVLTTGEGLVDFHRDRVSMRQRFAMPVGDHDTPEAQAVPAETLMLVDRDAVYVPLSSEDVQSDDTWMAVDIGAAGVIGSPIGIFIWLRGVTEATEVAVTAPAPAAVQARVVLDLGLAVRRSPDRDRDAVRASLDAGREGLSTEVVTAEVALDADDRARWMRVVIPAGTSPVFAGATDETEVELLLDRFGVKVNIPLPDAQLRLSLAEFVASINTGLGDGESDPAAWPGIAPHRTGGRIRWQRQNR
ncbi:MAG: hypothetical protein LC635_04280 [Pseudonocardiaceae bacterium]|nr:hypothetical protein [Pseudonocardiaceae bacterium]